MKSTQVLIKPSIILILLVWLSACQQVRPGPITTATLVIPTASQSAYPPPNLTLGPTPLSYIPPQWPVVTPTPFPFPTATIPLPTPIIPLAATITRTPGDISVANLLPPHGNYLDGVVADIASGGKPAAVVLSDGPIGPVLYPNDLDQAELHLTVYPLAQNSLLLPAANPKSNIRMDAIDLNQDGQRELMLRPDWKGGLIFQSTGLTAWPRLLDSNGDMPFTGGEFGVFEEKQRFPFNTLQPVLYYAGVKQAAIGDMDGDGLYEVDLSYSDREGADTWQVIRYHWKDGQYEYSGEKFTRPAAEPILPAQFLKWVEALNPLPDLAMGGKGTPGPVLVTALQVSRLDLNRDGRNETLLVYGVTSPVKTFSIAGAGLAIYDAEDHLTWKSDFQRFPAGEVEASVRMVELTPGESGILFQYVAVENANGGHRQGQAILYRWNGLTIQPVWQKVIVSGGTTGFGFGGRLAGTVWLEDIDHDHRQEILVQEAAGMQDAQLGINYLLHKPGSFVYKWDGSSYSLVFLLEKSTLQPIRPNQPVSFAPRLGHAHAPDWKSPNIAQLEYGRGANNLVYGDDRVSPFIWYAWSDGTLYIRINTTLRSTIFIGLDSDLNGDFNDSALNGDDFTLQVAAPATDCASQPAQIIVLHPAEGIRGLVSSSGLGPTTYDCSIEIAVPLQALGLAPSTLIQDTGWMTDGEGGMHQYFPVAGRAIGLAGWYNNPGTSQTASSETDPTTWGTLIFMADQ